MKEKKLIVSIFCVIFSFFLGYLFAQRQDFKELQTLRDTQEYVNIIIKNKKLEFVTSSPKVEVLINGEKNSTGSIILE